MNHSSLQPRNHRTSGFMPQTHLHFARRALLWIFCAGMVLTAGTGLGADVSKAFFEADACARELRKNQAAQKLRQNWERCLERFQAVYQQDPRGPWAPASLFQTGVLYRDLSKFSHNPADGKRAADAFEQIQKQFPGSAYRERAAAELKKMSAPAAKEEKPSKAPAREKAAAAAAPAPKEPPAGSKKSSAEARAARQGYQSAEACFQQLRRGKPTEANRREWMLRIGRSRNVYLEDPTGEWVAASLYMEGMLYYDLHKGLKFNSDLKAAQENFEKIVKEHPDSPYAGKAAKELQGMPRPWAPAAAARRTPAPPAAEPPAAPAPKSVRPSQKPTPEDEGLSIVQDLRHWSNPDYTRVVVYADRETEFSHRLLKADPSIDKPPRLYVDLAHSTIGEGVQKTIPINDDLLSDARAARNTLDSVRVVVDIKSFETYKVFSLKDPFRIVIDVWGGNGAAPPASPGAGEALADKTRTMPRGALAKQLALGVRRVVVDPGHGGKDFGAPGFIPGVHEKDIVLKIARRLARKLREDVGLEVLMTRNDDRYLTLEERTAFANTHRADLFISVHTNASRDPRAYGTETYFLNLATDDESIRVAAMENATSTKNISDLHSILNDLLKNAKINESSRLAAFVQSGMITHLAANGHPRIKDKGVKQAPFYVLLGARMPSILVETAFISNREECRLLTTAAFQEQTADAIVRGIRSYIQDISPTALSQPPRGSAG